MNPLLFAALWGMAGAFMYAAPKLSACAFSTKPEDGPPMRCILDAVIALVIGALAAAAWGQFALEFLKRTEAGALGEKAAQGGGEDRSREQPWDSNHGVNLVGACGFVKSGTAPRHQARRIRAGRRRHGHSARDGARGRSISPAAPRRRTGGRGR